MEPSIGKLRESARQWIDAWNRRDLDGILEHYADNVRICSPMVTVRTGSPDGWLHGKANLRDYFAMGLRKPDIRFELIDVLIGINAVTVVYRRENGAMVADCSELDAHGRIIRMIACYGSPAGTP
ncbi:MAG: nuclear transport factor 2 family protein [Deltaproteobacteria bacterium]|nr:nuclear transport factor 2 family protein [Deltaproteobacteria bacterium]